MTARDESLRLQLKTVQDQQAEGMKQRKARLNATAKAVGPVKSAVPPRGGATCRVSWPRKR